MQQTPAFQNNQLFQYIQNHSLLRLEILLSLSIFMGRYQALKLNLATANTDPPECNRKEFTFPHKYINHLQHFADYSPTSRKSINPLERSVK